MAWSSPQWRRRGPEPLETRLPTSVPALVIAGARDNDLEGGGREGKAGQAVGQEPLRERPRRA